MTILVLFAIAGLAGSFAHLFILRSLYIDFMIKRSGDKSEYPNHDIMCLKFWIWNIKKFKENI